MKIALITSIAGHAAVLLYGLVSFAAKTSDAPPTEPMPIDIVSAQDVSQLFAGTRNAAKADTPKRLVEKIADAKHVDIPTAKVVEKPEMITASAAAPPPAPPAKVPETKPVTPQAQPEPKTKEVDKKLADIKSDPIAEALKKEEAKKPELRKAEVKPAPAKKPEPKPQLRFDADHIAALLDRREPQRVAAAGDSLNRTLMLGTRTGDSPQLSQSEIDAFRQKLKSCWNPPAGAPNADKMSVPITIRLKLDRTLASPPQVEMAARDAYTQAMIDSAVRAIIQCQPYTMFSVARFENWKELPLDFDPVEMFGH